MRFYALVILFVHTTSCLLHVQWLVIHCKRRWLVVYSTQSNNTFRASEGKHIIAFDLKKIPT